MVANIYRLFRSMIGDNSSPYDLPDFDALYYLDAAIDKLSSLSYKRKTETKTLDATDIANGYFELTKSIVEIEEELTMSQENYDWYIEGDNKIYIADANAFASGDSFTITYRYKYSKFNGEVLSQSDMDIPSSVELGVVFYAIGVYMLERNITDADTKGVVGSIKEKNEDGVKVVYGSEGTVNKLKTPEEFKKTGIRMMREQRNAQSRYFSI